MGSDMTYMTYNVLFNSLQLRCVWSLFERHSGYFVALDVESKRQAAECEWSKCRLVHCHQGQFLPPKPRSN